MINNDKIVDCKATLPVGHQCPHRGEMEDGLLVYNLRKIIFLDGQSGSSS